MRSLDANAQFGWIESAPAWLATVESDANRTHLLDQIMLEICGDVNGFAVADIGCGEGRFCRMLEARGAWCIGIDPVDPLLEAGLAACSKARLIRGSAECIPLRSSTFGLVIAYLSLIDVPDFRAAIREMSRILKPGGRIVIANVHSMASAVPGWLKDEEGRRVYWRVDHYFREEGEVAAWNGIEILNWHRPLEAYMQEFLAQNLRLTKFIEPKPTEQEAEDCPQIADHRRVPNFVVMEWKKN